MMETIEYGFANSAFGELLVARTMAGICHVHFVTTTRRAAVDELCKSWNGSMYATPDNEMARNVVHMMIEDQRNDIALDLHGTPFQMKVWAALRLIPFGHTASYRQIAIAIGKPTAVRAVASAIAHNPVAILVPCHRVIHSNGSVGQYHWGEELKRHLIQWEHNIAYGSDGHGADTLL